MVLEKHQIRCIQHKQVRINFKMFYSEFELYFELIQLKVWLNHSNSDRWIHEISMWDIHLMDLWLHQVQEYSNCYSSPIFTLLLRLNFSSPQIFLLCLLKVYQIKFDSLHCCLKEGIKLTKRIQLSFIYLN